MISLNNDFGLIEYDTIKRLFQIHCSDTLSFLEFHKSLVTRNLPFEIYKTTRLDKSDFKAYIIEVQNTIIYIFAGEDDFYTHLEYIESVKYNYLTHPSVAVF